MTTPIITRHQSRSLVTTALQADRLGVPAVSFFLMSGVALLLVVAGVMPTFFAVTGLVAAPIFFIAGGVVLAFFAVGYIAMARRVRNAGAFYAMATAGLGRPTGVSAALIAVAGYNALQIALYGLFGFFLSGLAADKWHLHLSWGLWALSALVLVGALGLRKIDISARVLAVLSLAEVAVLLVLAGFAFTHPAAGGIAWGSFSPTHLIVPGVGAAGVIVILGFIGFETAVVYSEEVKHHKRTIMVATFLVLIGVTGLYALSGLSYLTFYGTDKIADASAAGPDTLFAMGSPLVADVARVLFVTSIFAGMLTYHNVVTRYMYALGREGAILPRRFSETGQRSGQPYVASLFQSGLAVAVIGLYAYMGWDPLVQLFFWVSTAGSFAVLVLLALTSVAVIAYFARHPDDETVWRRLIAPVVAALLLGTMVVFAVLNYATLMGVAPDAWQQWVAPIAVGVLFVVGLLWGLIVRARSRAAYEAIGRGPDAALMGVNR